MKAALGFRTHSGWCVAVALREPAAAPVVVLRRRIEMTAAGIGAKQPYHAAERMKLAEAEAFLQECSDASQAMANRAIQNVALDLTKKGCEIQGACVLAGSGRTAPTLAATLASHALIHTAEGDFYREVIRRACESAGLKTSAMKEKGLQVQSSISEMGKLIGPPWTQDEKLSAMAAWLLLQNP